MSSSSSSSFMQCVCVCEVLHKLSSFFSVDANIRIYHNQISFSHAISCSACSLTLSLQHFILFAPNLVCYTHINMSYMSISKLYVSFRSTFAHTKFQIEFIAPALKSCQIYTYILLVGFRSLAHSFVCSHNSRTASFWGNFEKSKEKFACTRP